MNAEERMAFDQRIVFDHFEKKKSPSEIPRILRASCGISIFAVVD
jgi:hypothetical protein